MTGELFISLSLGGLALFIIWEGWQRHKLKPLQRVTMAQGFFPGQSNYETVLFAFAGVGALFGFVLLEEPPVPPFTGRGAFLSALLYDWLGSLGFAFLTWAGSVIALVEALSVRRKRLSGDRIGN
jgi:hypothetical protein